MAEDYGVNFSPLTRGTRQTQDRQQTGGSPVQDAIRTLSLRLPKVVGAASPIPQPLLASQGGAAFGRPSAAPTLAPFEAPPVRGGMASPGGASLSMAPQFDLDTFLRVLFGAGQTSRPMPAQEPTYPTPKPVGPTAQGPQIPPQAPPMSSGRIPLPGFTPGVETGGVEGPPIAPSAPAMQPWEWDTPSSAPGAWDWSPFAR